MYSPLYPVIWYYIKADFTFTLNPLSCKAKRFVENNVHASEYFSSGFSSS
jgi:hypothetical protein